MVKTIVALSRYHYIIIAIRNAVIFNTIIHIIKTLFVHFINLNKLNLELILINVGSRGCALVCGYETVMLNKNGMKLKT
jgi:hypothetical protein